jgi:hypothetical protein
MNELRRIYEQIYQSLRSRGVETLAAYVKERGLDEYALNAIRTLASLPDPRLVTRREAAAIASECISRYLEFCYQTENIGELARQLRDLLEREPNQLLDVPLSIIPRALELSEAENLLRSNNTMLLNLTTAVGKLATAVDIDLKGQCPHCHGPLVEVLVDAGGANRELRLRCKQQSKAACRSVDWYLQDAQTRNP